jgi:hypothetical protein
MQTPRRLPTASFLLSGWNDKLPMILTLPYR